MPCVSLACGMHLDRPGRDPGGRGPGRRLRFPTGRERSGALHHRRPCPSVRTGCPQLVSAWCWRKRRAERSFLPVRRPSRSWKCGRRVPHCLRGRLAGPSWSMRRDTFPQASGQARHATSASGIWDHEDRRLAAGCCGLKRGPSKGLVISRTAPICIRVRDGESFGQMRKRMVPVVRGGCGHHLISRVDVRHG